MVRLTVVAAFAAIVLGGAPAGAARGVALDLGRIDVRQSLSRGGVYRLPVVGVRNPGTERTRYQVVVRPLEGEKAPPTDWFDFSPQQFPLDPHESMPVSVKVSIPTDATPAEYRVLLAAEIVTNGRGTRIGAAAAARLRFRVEPSSALEAWWLWSKSFLGDHQPWSYVLPLAAFAALALRQLRRRFTLTLVKRA